MTYVNLIIIIIKRISTAPIYHTRWQHRALYNNTNYTQFLVTWELSVRNVETARCFEKA